MKNFGEFLNFWAIFYKFFKSLWWVSTHQRLLKKFEFPYLLNVPLSSPKFWRRHCSTGLERNSCLKFFPMLPPRTKILAPPLYRVYIVLYIYVVTCAPPQLLYVADPMLMAIAQTCARMHRKFSTSLALMHPLNIRWDRPHPCDLQVLYYSALNIIQYCFTFTVINFYRLLLLLISGNWYIYIYIYVA